MILLRMGPVMARPRGSGLVIDISEYREMDYFSIQWQGLTPTTHPPVGNPCRCGRCRDWRHATHSHSHHEIWDAYCPQKKID